ncbi:MAG: transcriptional regulator [Caldilineae bacterium]|nr:MAG: transcriptional regulator [Caldilineae bacterium]
MSPQAKPTYSLAEVEAALAQGPGERVVLLNAGSSARKVAESLVALANHQGGLVILGVNAAGQPTGLQDAEETVQLATTAALLTHPPLIAPLPQAVELNGKTLCVVEVPPGLPHVYSIKGQYLVRDGPHNRPLLPDELRRLLLNRAEAGFETQLVAGATLDDLDPERINAYAQMLGGVIGEDARSLLLSRGCLVEQQGEYFPTVAGILLFGREPQRWLRSAEITCVRYPGEQMSDDFLREDVRGVLPDQIRRAEAFVADNMRRGMRIRGLAREDTPEYPISIVREAIVNAVAHRDYSIRGDSIRLLMFSDRLEVYSPGRLPGHVTLENLVEERFSRNEALVQVLSEMGFIDRLGYGIDRIIAVCEAEGLERPRFAETAAGFKITIYGHGRDLVGAAPPANLWAHLHLNPRQEKALAFLQENRRITNRDYQALCPDTSPETLRRDFADLVDRGILLKIGEKRATYYVLK